MTDLKTLKQLVKLMVDNDLTELDLEGEGEKVKLRRGEAGPEVQYVTPAPPSAMAAPAPAAPVAPAGSDGIEPGGQALDDGAVTINSPMVGTFYSSPSPDAATFVTVGEKVEAETVVCIIEAMKVFNEIKAEKAGTIERMLVDNGQAVEFGEPLFVIKPD